MEIIISNEEEEEEEEDIIIIITVREREIRESYSSISHIILYVHIDVSVTFFLSCEKFFFFVERYGLTNRYEKKTGETDENG
jgi:hypothetical protein